MKVLFLYKYGILGGVCTQLHHRMISMPRDIEVHCAFMTSQGAEELLQGLCTLHFGVSPESLEKLIHEIGFDIIVLIDTEEYLIILEKIEPLPPVVIEVHTSIKTNLEYLTRIPEALNSEFLTVSEYMREEVRERVGSSSRLGVVGNIIDTDKFYFTPFEEDENSNQTPPIIWVGKIDDHKNWRLAVDISSKVQETGLNHEFWIVGGHTAPPSRVEELFDYIEKKGVLDRFKWYDKVIHSDIPDLIREVRNRGGVGLVTSRGESFGMSIMESLLVGLPVICSNTGAISELCEEAKYMPLYEIDNPNSAADEIIGILGGWIKNPKYKKMVESETKKLSSRFNSKHTRKKYWQYLENII